MQQKNSLSDCECDAVVAFTVLAILMQQLHPDAIEKVRRRAMTKFVDIGDKDIISEAHEFFALALRKR